jgi:hypothetical protein
LTTPLTPANGVSRTATTGIPETDSILPLMMSVTKMSGAK